MPQRAAICLIVNGASVRAMGISLIMHLLPFVLNIFLFAAGSIRFLDSFEATEASIKYFERSKSRGFQDVLSLLMQTHQYTHNGTVPATGTGRGCSSRRQGAHQ